MMTRQEIQADLREIRYYYSMKEMFDKSADTVKPLAIIEKVNRYNKAMENAPAKMLALYLSLSWVRSQPDDMTQTAKIHKKIHGNNLIITNCIQKSIEKCRFSPKTGKRRKVSFPIP